MAGCGRARSRRTAARRRGRGRWGVSVPVLREAGALSCDGRRQEEGVGQEEAGRQEEAGGQEEAGRQEEASLSRSEASRVSSHGVGSQARSASSIQSSISATP